MGREEEGRVSVSCEWLDAAVKQLVLLSNVGEGLKQLPSP